MITITRKQKCWLDSRGGRNINDVEEDEKGLFVWMGDGDGGDMKVYIPVEKPVEKKGNEVNKKEKSSSK